MVVASNIRDREFEKFSTDGSVKVSLSSCLVPEPFNSISLTQDSTHDVWTYKMGLITVAVVTITYTDTTKETIFTVVRS
jgi:hypothetical protein